MDITMGNVYYTGSNPNTHLVQRSTTTSTSDVKSIEGAIGGSKSSIKDLTVNSPNYFEEDERIIYVATRSAKILPGIEKVIFNPPATIVTWQDGTKTVVKCGKGEEFCEETGLAMAIARRYSGSRSSFLKTVGGAKHPEERK